MYDEKIDSLVVLVETSDIESSVLFEELVKAGEVVAQTVLERIEKKEAGVLSHADAKVCSLLLEKIYGDDAQPYFLNWTGSNQESLVYYGLGKVRGSQKSKLISVIEENLYSKAFWRQLAAIEVIGRLEINELLYGLFQWLEEYRPCDPTMLRAVFSSLRRFPGEKSVLRLKEMVNTEYGQSLRKQIFLSLAMFSDKEGADLLIDLVFEEKGNSTSDQTFVFEAMLTLSLVQSKNIIERLIKVLQDAECGVQQKLFSVVVLMLISKIDMPDGNRELSEQEVEDLALKLTFWWEGNRRMFSDNPIREFPLSDFCFLKDNPDLISAYFQKYDNS